jgi:hypothetical protein
MSPLELLGVLGAVALVLVRWLPIRTRWPVALAATAVVLLSGPRFSWPGHAGRCCRCSRAR